VRVLVICDEVFTEIYLLQLTWLLEPNSDVEIACTVAVLTVFKLKRARTQIKSRIN